MVLSILHLVVFHDFQDLLILVQQVVVNHIWPFINNFHWSLSDVYQLYLLDRSHCEVFLLKCQYLVSGDLTLDAYLSITTKSLFAPKQFPLARLTGSRTYVDDVGWLYLHLLDDLGNVEPSGATNHVDSVRVEFELSNQLLLTCLDQEDHLRVNQELADKNQRTQASVEVFPVRFVKQLLALEDHTLPVHV